MLAKANQQGSQNGGNRIIKDMDFEGHYEQESDSYHVSFKTAELSFAVEPQFNDILMLEVGFCSGIPTGFRILNFEKNRKKQQFRIDTLKNILKQELKALKKTNLGRTFKQRELELNFALEKIFVSDSTNCVPSTSGWLLVCLTPSLFSIYKQLSGLGVLFALDLP